MRWIVNNAEEFPAFVDDRGLQQHGPNADGSFPPGWAVFEILPGGKQRITAEEWASISYDPARFAQMCVYEGWATGRIQQMPNVVHASTGPPAARLAAIDIVSVPGRAIPIYG